MLSIHSVEAFGEDVLNLVTIDVVLIEDRFLDSCLEVADPTTVDQFKLNRELELLSARHGPLMH